MTKLFISYRRSDSLHVTGRVYDRLASKFGGRSLFRDVDSIPLGENFRRVIQDSVAKCDILLAVIGEEWVDVTDENGGRRLANEDDYVRLEIESALNAGIPVIPLLIGNTAMPRDDQLPATLAPMLEANAAPVRADPDFHSDVDKLIRAIESLHAKKQWRADRAITGFLLKLFSWDLAVGPLTSFITLIVGVLLLVVAIAIISNFMS